MPLRDGKMFSDDEFVAAFSIILPPGEAREVRLAFNSAPDLAGFEDATPEELAAAPAQGPRSYDGDILDLLAMVSDSCAERAWRLMEITPAEGERRRAEFRRRLNDALRIRDAE